MLSPLRMVLARKPPCASKKFHRPFLRCEAGQRGPTADTLEVKMPDPSCCHHFDSQKLLAARACRSATTSFCGPGFSRSSAQLESLHSRPKLATATKRDDYGEEARIARSWSSPGLLVAKILNTKNAHDDYYGGRRANRLFVLVLVVVARSAGGQEIEHGTTTTTIGLLPRSRSKGGRFACCLCHVVDNVVPEFETYLGCPFHQRAKS